MKLNLDDNGYVVGWTLDESDKKLSSNEVNEKNHNPYNRI